MERRLILDLSFPHGASINDGILKDMYLGRTEKLQLPSIDTLVENIIELGSDCKIDLAHCYKQFFIDPLEIPLMGFKFNGKFYFDCTLSMGSCSSARCCQRATSAVVFIYTKHGYFAINYLDDLGGADTAERAEETFRALRKLLRDFRLQESPK